MSARTWTVLELLRWIQGHFAERGIDTPRLDAECLLAHALGVDRLQLYLQYDKPVVEDERARLRELVRRRTAERVPVSLLTGAKEFWSLPLAVTPDVLTPRPDTETLVQAGLDLVPDREAAARIWDVGTGSGAVALALARERPKAWLLASDVSGAALDVARRNASALGLDDRLEWAHGPLLEPGAGREFDLVVSNPPYLAHGEADGLAPELAHEPPEALFAGPVGTEVLEALVAGVLDVLAPSAGFAVELAPHQAETVAGWCREAGLREVRVVADLAGRPRVVSARAPGDA